MTAEQTLHKKLELISLPDKAAGERCHIRWNSIAKPLGSLGLLEEALVRFAALTGDEDWPIDRKALLILCADNGVVARGVTQTGQEVTSAVAANMACGKASVCHMASIAGAKVFPVDAGMTFPCDALPLQGPRRGTDDIAAGPAMTREEAAACILEGISLVEERKAEGFTLLATGEMGIGNTTTSSAMTAVFLSQPVEKVTGVGAGLSSEGLVRKVEAIESAIRVNQPDPADPLDTLAKLGGFDIAVMTGVFLGGAIHHIPVLLDGFISSVAALTAARLCPDAKAAMLATHCSGEPASRMLLEALELSPLIDAGLRLGEGSGAVAAMPLLDMARAVYRGMPTFRETGIEEYKPLK
ncbi:MAG: nicotinate-nucleotide--dimethylbenzimidazole phosphoribosyltransferase [Oscillospiraceae bacterium]